jgi:hypothetical protein
LHFTVALGLGLIVSTVTGAVIVIAAITVRGGVAGVVAVIVIITAMVTVIIVVAVAVITIATIAVVGGRRGHRCHSRSYRHRHGAGNTDEEIA